MFKSVNVLSLDNGKNVVESLAEYCEKKNISSAIILGIIGSLGIVKFAVIKKGPPQVGGNEKFAEEIEQLPTIGWMVLSAQGSLSTFEGKKKFHIHTALRSPYTEQMVGGHLIEAETFNTVEIYIGELPYQLKQALDPKIGMPAVVST